MRSPRDLGAALRLGVTGDAVALVATRRWRRQASLLAELPLDASHAMPAALLASVSALFDGLGVGRGAWPLTVVLADELVRLWHVTPPSGCSRLADLEGAAALRFQQLHGEPAAAWQLSADWQLERPFLAAAVARPLLAALRQASDHHALRLVEVAPQFVVLWNRWRASLATGDWFGVVHDGVLTLAVCDGGGVAALRALAMSAPADAAWLRAQLAREALRLNRPAPARLRLCGAVPAAWREVDGCAVLDAAPAAQDHWSAAARLAWSGCGA